MASGSQRLTVSAYVDGVLSGDPIVLARAITLVESDLPADADAAAAVLEAVLPSTGGARRVGITGVPGVGKSTFIDALGMHLTRERGERVAVLSIDPSSVRTRGSILGDKTRMERLALEPRAFIRPSPARGHAGGVAPRTREAILLCEAAGYQHVLVETVGVGQTETAVRSMTDFFLLLMLAGAGDELQGIKRGILEMVDAMAVTKADGDNVGRAERARAEYAAALRLFPPSSDGWTPQVFTCSAIEKRGIEEIWQAVLDHHALQTASGALEARRREQAVEWMRELIASGMRNVWQEHPAITARLAALESAVADGRMSAFAAAREAVSLVRPEPKA
jgi:LAO/AO transport system kinase